MIDAGSLDRRIVLQKSTPVTDDFGNSIDVWSDTHISAGVHYMTNDETWRAQQVQSNAELRFTIRWGFDARVTDRIIFDGKAYDIVGVRELGRQEGQELTAATGDQ
jgi:SPP1 family predicted phage head-tail adaptor